MSRSKSCCKTANIWILLAVQLLLNYVSASSMEKSELPRISQRTSWPTETGTMVRILRSQQPALLAAESDWSAARSYKANLEDEDSPLDYPVGKRNLFLRTSKRSRSSSADNDMMEDLGEEDQETMFKRDASHYSRSSSGNVDRIVPKRNKPKQESPIFFRTFRSAKPYRLLEV